MGSLVDNDDKKNLILEGVTFDGIRKITFVLLVNSSTHLILTRRFSYAKDEASAVN